MRMNAAKFVATIEFLLYILLLSTWLPSSRAYYLPGGKPRAFSEGDEIELRVNKMTSSTALLPIEYYSLPFCRPLDGGKLYSKNLGEFLSGDRISSSPYRLKMKTDMYCEHLCVSHLGRMVQPGIMPNKFVRAIRKRYHNNWLVDDLPAASRYEDENIIAQRYFQGFPIGFVDNRSKLAYVHNHVNIEIMYHPVENEVDKYHVVRFTVQPLSIKHDVDRLEDKVNIRNPIASCDRTLVERQHTTYEMFDPRANVASQLASGIVLFTYDVTWVENRHLQWSDRWDVYLTMDDAIPAKVHWYSICNSVIVSILLAATAAMGVVLFIRNIHSDLDADTHVYPSDEVARAAELEEKGLKLVHVTVFAPPESSTLLAVFCGTGAQLLCTALAALLHAFLGFSHPHRRGHLVMSILGAFFGMCLVNGYVTALVHKTFKGEDWKGSAFVSSLFFPGLSYVAFLMLCAISLLRASTQFPPLYLVLELLVYVVLCACLVHVGAYCGWNRDAVALPDEPRTILLGMLDQRWLRRADRRYKAGMALIAILFNVLSIALAVVWFVRSKVKFRSPKIEGAIAILVGGMIAFASIFVDLFYILCSMWLEYWYYTFGFLFVVLFILLLTCVEVSVLFNYYQLSTNGYHSWWLQFFCSGAVSIYVLFYSLFHFSEYLDVVSGDLYAFLVYFGYMTWLSLALFLMTGFTGSVASFWFVKTLLSIAKAGEDLRPLVAGADGEQDEIELSTSHPKHKASDEPAVRVV